MFVNNVTKIIEIYYLEYNADESSFNLAVQSSRTVSTRGIKRLK